MVGRKGTTTAGSVLANLGGIMVNPDDTEELALTLAGKKKKLNRAHFEKLGKDMGLNDKQVEGVFKRFIKQLLTGLIVHGYQMNLRYDIRKY